MRVLVTGATGFVGRNLMAELERRSDLRPVAGVRSLTGAASLDALPLGSLGVDTPPSMIGIDAVVHCAARVHVMRDTATNPLEHFRRTNVLGSIALANRAAQDGVKRFVYLSSVKVNGDETTLGHPYKVTAPASPNDPYGVSKYEAELALSETGRKTGMELVIIRPVLVYGQEAKGNFASLVKIIKAGIPLPLGGMNNRRSLVSIHNLCDLIAICLTHPNAGGQCFFAADRESVSTTELVAAIARSVGREARLFNAPRGLIRTIAQALGKSPQYDRLFGSLEVDTRSNFEILGWTAPQSTEQGILDACSPRDDHKPS